MVCEAIRRRLWRAEGEYRGLWFAAERVDLPQHVRGLLHRLETGATPPDVQEFPEAGRAVYTAAYTEALRRATRHLARIGDPRRLRSRRRKRPHPWRVPELMREATAAQAVAEALRFALEHGGDATPLRATIEQKRQTLAYWTALPDDPAARAFSPGAPPRIYLDTYIATLEGVLAAADGDGRAEAERAHGGRFPDLDQSPGEDAT